MKSITHFSFSVKSNPRDIRDKIYEIYGTTYRKELPTINELKSSFYQGNKFHSPFKKDNDFYMCFNNKCIRDFLYYKDGNIKNVCIYKGYFGSCSFEFFFNDSGVIAPLFRLEKCDSYQKAFGQFLTHGLIPKKLKNRDDYLKLMNYKILDMCKVDVKIGKEIKVKIKDLNKIYNAYDQGKNLELYIDSGDLVERLLNEDKRRADIAKYSRKLVEDSEQGHWSLCEKDDGEFKKPIVVNLNNNLYSRDPRSSINEGIIGIDFGTKSTVVAYQGKNTNIYPLRIGTGNLDKQVEGHHYENPTIMEFINLENFMKKYNERKGRPYTKWEHITVSHTAFETLKDGSKSEEINSFLYELKQWAGNKNKKLKIVDKKNKVADLPPYLELNEGIDPIELYAYYLGLYINNQNNGIYMNYSLSFPVTYEIKIREKILNSFKKGIKKSLPYELHRYEEEIEKLRVESGASEPAAYSVVALQEYGFDPEDDEKVFYGVFDFGGGTTDFDFGIWREAKDNREEGRYEYVIEHFGSGGDRYLGGENILELLAYEVFKANKDKLLNQKIEGEKSIIEFTLPAGKVDRPSGFEALINLTNPSREAKMNMRQLMEKLRGFWERHEGYEDSYKDSIKCNLVTRKGHQLANFELDIDLEGLNKIIRERIEIGVINFFQSVRLAFENEKIDLNSIDKINIFLAGNSSKAEVVKELFNEYITKETSQIKEKQGIKNDIFEMFPPLGSEEGYAKMEELGLEKTRSLESPTSKTGVAYGLIHCRKGGNILVKDYNVEEDIVFKYYLGRAKKKKFKVSVQRNHPYNEWIRFIDAREDTFEIYYTDQPMASNNTMSIEKAIKKSFIIDYLDDDADVYIRIVEPTKIQYVVATEEGIQEENYLCDIVEVELN